MHEDDEWYKAEDIARFVANKIKLCKKCRTELNYKEIFYNIDKICNQCKGLPAFEEAEQPQKSPTPEATQTPQSTPAIDQIDNSLSHLPPFQRQLYSKYPQMQQWIEKSEQELKEQQNNGGVKPNGEPPMEEQ
jgi:hypothetical protein